MNHKLLSIAALCLVGSATSAHALDSRYKTDEDCDKPRSAQHASSRHERAGYDYNAKDREEERFLRNADRNRDGKVTREEWHVENDRVQAIEEGKAKHPTKRDRYNDRARHARFERDYRDYADRSRGRDRRMRERNRYDDRRSSANVTRIRREKVERPVIHVSTRRAPAYETAATGTYRTSASGGVRLSFSLGR